MKALASLFAFCVLTCASPAQWTAEWPMDAAAGSTAYDISPNGNHGILMNFAGTPWVPGMFANALAFDGVDDYVDSNLQPSIYDGLGAPYSIAYWVKAPAQQNVFVYAEGTIGSMAILIFGSGQYLPDADKFRVYCRNDQGDVPFTGVSNAVVYDDTWHHVAFVDVSGEISLYIDGVLDGGNIAYDPARLPGMPGHGTFSFNTASIGGLRRGSLCCQMLGVVDDLRLYDFAMTPSDVLLAMAGLPLLPASASIGEYGVGCGAGPFDLVGGGSAAFGGPGIQMQMQSGPANGVAFLMCGFGPLVPVDLAPYGLSGCTAYPANFMTFLAAVLDASGAAAAPVIQFPNDPALACLKINFQAAALAAPTIELSDAVIAQLGL